MRRTFCTLLSALLAAALAMGGAAAQRQVTYGELTQAERIAFIERLVAAGDLDAAQTFLSNSRFNEGDAGYRAALAQSVIFKRKGRLDAAEDLLRRILDERPAYTGVRLQLAEVLALQGRRTAAAYHLQLLADAAPDQDSRSRFENFIDQINPEKPFTYGGFVTLAPSSNYNNGAGGDIIMVNGVPFVIDPAGRAQSGLGLRAGVNAAFTHRLNETFSAYAAGSAVMSEYSGRAFDTVTGDARIGLRYLDSRRMLSAELITDRRWIDLKPIDYGLGGRIFLRQPLAAKLLFSGEMQFVRRTFDRDPDAALNTFSTMARLTYSFTPARSLYVQAGYVKEDAARRRHVAYQGGYVEIGGFAELPFAINGSLALKAGLSDYDGLFPGSPFARRDRFYELRASFLKRDLSYAGFSPRLSLTYFRQQSNVALYDYDRYGADITFTKEF